MNGLHCGTLVLAWALSGAVAAQDLRTHAERSGWQETGRYEEVERLCHGFAQAHPRTVRCLDVGRTPQGRTMWALAASQAGALTPQSARRQGLPVVLVQGGIHAGEIDGKDAGFAALSDVLAGRAARGALQRQVLLFVPVFNVDGHERFGAWSRPNQRGPRETGWRVTAQNLNLNRDYAKADAPEMQAMLRLVQAWDPLVVVDLHATDGAQFEHDLSIQVEPGHAGPPPLQAAGRALRDGVLAKLSAQGAQPQPFYMAFEKEDDPASGFADNVPPPRFSHGYFWLRNRFGMLVETHSWRSYPERVLRTRQTIVAVLEEVATHGRDWQRAARAADAQSLAGSTLALTFAPTRQSRLIDFKGYAYTRERSELSGALMTRYDERTPQVWRVPLRDDVQPELTLAAPRAGYLVRDGVAGDVAAKLAQHGIRFSRLGRAHSDAPVQVWRAETATPAARPAEGRQRMSLTGRWQEARADLPAGTLYVPVAQPLAKLVVALMEPQAPDSLAAWGWFNGFFERKEYMEPYVAEAVGREMLAADPELAAAFQARLARDAEFAASPGARLDYFYRRHPAWDAHYMLLPVMRLDQELPR